LNPETANDCNVKTVYETPHDNYYHLVLKNSSSAKAGTAADSDEPQAEGKEFKLVKVDKYL